MGFLARIENPVIGNVVRRTEILMDNDNNNKNNNNNNNNNKLQK